jgi:hypothetical protein
MLELFRNTQSKPLRKPTEAQIKWAARHAVSSIYFSGDGIDEIVQANEEVRLDGKAVSCKELLKTLTNEKYEKKFWTAFNTQYKQMSTQQALYQESCEKGDKKSIALAEQKCDELVYLEHTLPSGKVLKVNIGRIEKANRRLGIEKASGMDRIIFSAVLPNLEQLMDEIFEPYHAAVKSVADREFDETGELEGLNNWRDSKQVYVPGEVLKGAADQLRNLPEVELTPQDDAALKAHLTAAIKAAAELAAKRIQDIPEHLDNINDIKWKSATENTLKLFEESWFSLPEDKRAALQQDHQKIANEKKELQSLHAQLESHKKTALQANKEIQKLLKADIKNSAQGLTTFNTILDLREKTGLVGSLKKSIESKRKEIQANSKGVIEAAKPHWVKSKAEQAEQRSNILLKELSEGDYLFNPIQTIHALTKQLQPDSKTGDLQAKVKAIKELEKTNQLESMFNPLEEALQVKVHEISTLSNTFTSHLGNSTEKKLRQQQALLQSWGTAVDIANKATSSFHAAKAEAEKLLQTILWKKVQEGEDLSAEISQFKAKVQQAYDQIEIAETATEIQKNLLTETKKYKSAEQKSESDIRNRSIGLGVIVLGAAGYFGYELIAAEGWGALSSLAVWPVAVMLVISLVIFGIAISAHLNDKQCQKTLRKLEMIQNTFQSIEQEQTNDQALLAESKDANAAQKEVDLRTKTPERRGSYRGITSGLGGAGGIGIEEEGVKVGQGTGQEDGQLHSPTSTSLASVFAPATTPDQGPSEALHEVSQLTGSSFSSHG